MTNKETPSSAPIQLGIRLTPDDAQQLLLHVEAGGFFPVPPKIAEALRTIQVYMPAEALGEMSARFVLHAMLSNQAQ